MNDRLPWSISTRFSTVSKYFPDQINARDRRELRWLSKDARVIIDIGTFCGAAAECFLLAQPGDGHVFTVDIFKSCFMPYVGQVDGEEVLQQAQRRLNHFGERAKIIRSESTNAANMFAPETADLVFLDAAHDYESVLTDIRAWLPILKPAGVIAGHDFDRECYGPLFANIERFKHLEIGPDNAHYGVFAAVVESFNQVTVTASKRSSVWWVTPEQR